MSVWALFATLQHTSTVERVPSDVKLIRKLGVSSILAVSIGCTSRGVEAAASAESAAKHQPPCIIEMTPVSSKLRTQRGDEIRHLGTRMPRTSNGVLAFGGPIILQPADVRPAPGVESQLARELYAAAMVSVSGDQAHEIVPPPGSGRGVWNADLYASSGDTLHVVWRDSASGELRYAAAYGGEWSGVEVIAKGDDIVTGYEGASNLLVSSSGVAFFAPALRKVPGYNMIQRTWRFVRRDSVGWHMQDLGGMSGVDATASFLHADSTEIVLSALTPDSSEGFALYTFVRPRDSSTFQSPRKQWSSTANVSRGMEGIATPTGALLTFTLGRSENLLFRDLYVAHVAPGGAAKIDTLERESQADAVWISRSASGMLVLGIRTPSGSAYVLAQTQRWERVELSGSNWLAPPVVSFRGKTSWVHIPRNETPMLAGEYPSRELLGQLRCVD